MKDGDVGLANGPDDPGWIDLERLEIDAQLELEVDPEYQAWLDAADPSPMES